MKLYEHGFCMHYSVYIFKVNKVNPIAFTPFEFSNESIMPSIRNGKNHILGNENVTKQECNFYVQ